MTATKQRIPGDLADRVDELEKCLERQEDWAGKLVESLQRKMEILAELGEIVEARLDALEQASGLDIERCIAGKPKEADHD